MLVERNSSRSDKLITDYLSRHSASAASKSSSEIPGARQPFTALENLQAALCNLHMAHDMNKSAKTAGSKHIVTAQSGPADGSSMLPDVAEARSNEVHMISDNDTKAQASRLQSHPIECSPTPETACSTSRVQLGSDQPACRLFQCDPAVTLELRANSPSTPLQTDNHSSMSDRTEQSAPTLTCASTLDISASDDCLQRAQPAAAAAAYTPAAMQHTPDHTPSVYFTPYDSSPTYAHHAVLESPPPDGKEHWYSPGTIPDSGGSYAVGAHLTGCAFTPSHSFSRPDSPTLLTCQGSAFSADVLCQENDISSQWLLK